MTRTVQHMAKGRPATSFTQDPDMKGYDKFAQSTAKRVFKQGWVGKMSSNNHMILYAPDGQTTTALQHDTSAPRIQKNILAPITKWEQANKFVAPEAGEDGMFHCPADDCEHSNASRMGLVGHYTGNHSRPRICKVCNAKFSTPQGYRSHLAAHRDIIRPGDGLKTPQPKPAETPDATAEQGRPADSTILDAEVVEVEPAKTVAMIKPSKELHLMTTTELIELINRGNAAAVELARRAEGHEARLALIAETVRM